MDYMANGRRTINYGHIVVARTDTPGTGLLRQNRIVQEPAPAELDAEAVMVTAALEAGHMQEVR